MYHNHTLHHGVVFPAVLGAVQIKESIPFFCELPFVVIPAGSLGLFHGFRKFFITDFLACHRSLKPHVIVAAWNNVLFRPKCRNKKAVNHVVGSHRQLGWFIDQDVQLGIVRAFSIIHIPSPLLGRNTDVVGPIGNRSQAQVALSPNHKHSDEEERRQDGPGKFERGIVCRIAFGFLSLGLPVLH